MHQATRQPRFMTHVILCGCATALLSLFQPIPSVSAQQLIGAVSQETSGTGTQGRRIENIAPTLLYPTKSLEKKDAQTSTLKPHRLIRKSLSAPTATLQPIPLDASKSTSSTAVPVSALNDTTTQSKDTSVSSNIGAMAAPAITPLRLMSTAAATTSTTATPNTTPPHSLLSGTTANAGAAIANTSTGAGTPLTGRSMSRLVSEMTGLAQLNNPASSSPPPSAPVPPAIGASPASLSFAATQGGANPAAQTVSISNTGGGTLGWSASDNAAWLTLSPASGTGNGAVTLTATTGTLTAGSYSGAVTMSATGASPVTVPVTFTVTASPNISLNPSGLTYAATQGAANPANQTVSLTNTGGTLNWTVSDSASWLSVSPASGSSSSRLTAAVNTTGLAAGTYNGTVTVSAAGSSSKTVAVSLTVSAPTTSSATLKWAPNTDSDLAGYKVYRGTASGTYGAAFATVPAGILTYQATGLSANTTYFFVITAYDTAGNESSFSNEVSKSIF
jgi:hypothetical protein